MERLLPSGMENGNESPLKRFNNFRIKRLIPQLTEPQAKGLGLAIQSARAKRFRLPVDQSDALKDNWNIDTIRSLSENIEKSLPSTSEALLGRKILDPELIGQEVDRGFRALHIDDSNQQEAFHFWIESFTELPENGNRFTRMKESIKMGLTEISIGGKLLLTEVGTLIQKRFVKAGNFLIETPAKLQMAEDIIQTLSEQEKIDPAKNHQAEVIAQRYGLSSLDIDTYAHPDFRKRIFNSLLLSTSIYTLPRQILGWGAFWGFLYSPQLRHAIDNNSLAITAISAAVLTAGALARTRVDYAILKDRQYSPDILETTLGVMGGSVGQDHRLRTNPKSAFLGSAFDIAVSSLQPPYSAAWFIDSPYSIPAYLLAMYVDQVVFATTNVAWGTAIKIKERRHKNAVKPNKPNKEAKS